MGPAEGHVHVLLHAEPHAKPPFGTLLGSRYSRGSPGVSQCNSLWIKALRFMEGERPREPKENGLSPERSMAGSYARGSADIVVSRPHMGWVIGKRLSINDEAGRVSA